MTLYATLYATPIGIGYLAKLVSRSGLAHGLYALEVERSAGRLSYVLYDRLALRYGFCF